MSDAGSDTHDGHRDSKRRETGERIAREGLRLFLEQGFEATTIEQIAAAAGISRRTFFHYFEAKEESVFCSHGGMESAVTALIDGLPGETPPLRAVEQVLIELVSRFESPEALAIGRMIRQTPALMTRKQADYEHQERMLCAALDRRWPAPERRLTNRLAAMNGMGLIRICCETAHDESANQTLAQCLRKGFATLRGELGE